MSPAKSQGYLIAQLFRHLLKARVQILIGKKQPSMMP